MGELELINDDSINYILSSIDYLIDGRYEDDKKDLLNIVEACPGEAIVIEEEK